MNSEVLIVRLSYNCLTENVRDLPFIVLIPCAFKRMEP